VARSLDDVLSAIVRAAGPGAAVMTLGAGSIGTIPERLLALFEERARARKDGAT